MLVVPGYPTPHEAELRARAAALGVAGDVRLPGWVPGEDLEGLYALADVRSSSRRCYEGFGLPVLEAMARGVPVACSDRSSLPEVAGDAALLFDPEDAGAIAAAIERLLADGALASGLRAARAARRRRASPGSATAELTAASYAPRAGQRA